MLGERRLRIETGLEFGPLRVIQATFASTGLPFDHVISVAVANAFKPNIATYTKAAEMMGVRMDEVLFIANHAFDCIGAKSAGMRTAFIDRGWDEGLIAIAPQQN